MVGDGLGLGVEERTSSMESPLVRAVWESSFISSPTNSPTKHRLL